MVLSQYIIETFVKVLDYLQKTKTLKTWSEFCYWTKVKAKYVFLTTVMLLNEIQAFFVSLCFFRANVFQTKLDNISFSLSLTWRRTNYQTIKFLRLYLQNSKRNQKWKTLRGQARNQEFFRAGEVFKNKGTWTNI